ADWKKFIVKRSEFGGDATELRMQCRVAGKEDGCRGRFHRPSTPEGIVSLAKSSTGEVLRWHARDHNIPKRGLIPPIVLCDVASSALPNKLSDPQRRVPLCSGVARGDPRDSGRIQMI